MTEKLKPVDLVIVIDTSLSMGDEAEALSKALDAAVENARRSCPSDLRVEFLGIEGAFANSEFTTTVRQYLTGKGVTEDALRGRVKDSVANSGAQEDIARAVEDISMHFDWRPDAERNLFVLGDESLEGGEMTLDSGKIQACDKAIASALRHGVKIHTYLGTPFEDSPYPTPADEAAMEKEYKRLALRTGGEHYIYTKGVPDFAAVLKQTICASRVSQDESVASKKGEADKLEVIGSSGASGNICEHAGGIIQAVNTLAGVLDKLVDACGPGSEKQGHCRCHEYSEMTQDTEQAKPETPPVQKPESDPVQHDEQPALQEDQKPLPPPQKDELYAIVLQDRYWWLGNKDDNGDLYSHSAKTGELKAKLNNADHHYGQSNAIAPDGTHYVVESQSNMWMGRPGEHFTRSTSLSGGYPTIDSFGFRQDGMGYFFHASDNHVSLFKHDPANPNPPKSVLKIVAAPGESIIPFGKNENQAVTDIAFDGNDRAWLIGRSGNLWVVDDTSSTSEWQTRFVKQFPQLDLPGQSGFIGIAFDSTGNVYLCGGQKENNSSCRRFIARGSVLDDKPLNVIYDGGPMSGSYGVRKR